MIATISIMLCGCLAFIIHNLTCFIQAKNKLSPFAPSISQYFFKNRKYFLFGLIVGAILLTAIIFGLSQNKVMEWDAVKLRTIALCLCIQVVVTAIIIFTVHKLYKQLQAIESYAYTHHASQLQHQSKIDYNKVIKKIASYYVSGYSIWFVFTLVMIYF